MVAACAATSRSSGFPPNVEEQDRRQDGIEQRSR